MKTTINKKDLINEIESIVEGMYDTIILKPLNELECHRRYVKKLCQLFGYNQNSIDILTEIIKKNHK